MRFTLPAFFILSITTSCNLLDPGSSSDQKGKRASEEASKAAEPLSFMTQGEKLAFHRWLISEMHQQVFGSLSASQSEVNSWANVLSQRGSIEGVYHGMVLSKEYAGLEKGKVDIRALRFFAAEMAAMDYPLLVETHEDVRKAGEAYAKEYLSSSLYTLKRILGERILTESIKRKDDPEKLAMWYASFASKWAKFGIPFGAEQRNKADEAFHFRWAKENSLGLIQWELLNRAHRILNSLGNVVSPGGT